MTRSDASPLSPPWGSHALPEDGDATIHLGPSRLRVRAPAGEVWLAHAPGDGTRGGGGPDDVEAGEEEWVRWPVPETTDSLFLSPMFCDRPVVVEPEFAFRLLPRSRARIFVRVPLWIRAGVGGEGRAPLGEFPSLLLSDTWWGNPMEGELCYWLHTTARREVTPEVFAPHLAVCPLQLSNRSEEELRVERIALRVAHLSVFLHEGHFWADETRVRYRGAAEESEIEMAGEAPTEAPGASRVAEPRAPLLRGFRARSFARLKTLPGLGGL